MVKRIPGTLAALYCVMCAGAALGQTPPATAASVAGAAELQKVVAPFVDDETLVVGHIDVARVDTGVIETYINGLLDDGKVPAESELRKGVGSLRLGADTFLARFKQLGGRHVFMLLAHTDIWPHMQPGAFLVKIEPGGKVDGMKDFLSLALQQAGILPGATTAQGLANGDFEVVKLRDDVLYVGQEQPLKRLQDIKAVERKDLVFQTVEPLEVVMSLTADERRALRELMPTLPPEAGGGSTEALTKDGLQARLTLSLPPEPRLQIVFRHPLALKLSEATTFLPARAGSTEPEIDAVITHLRDLLMEDKDFNDGLKQFGEAGAKIKGVIKDVLTPDNGVLTLEAKHIRTLTPVLGITLQQSREAAMRNQSAANIRGLVQASLVYAADHRDDLPASLDVLVREGLVAPKQLVSPIDGKPYVYRPIFPKSTMDSGQPMIWEQGNGGGVNVGFGDGHVEFVRNPADLTRMIQEAEARKAKEDAQKKDAGNLP